MTERRKTFLAIAILAAIPTLLFLDVILGSGVFSIRDTAVYHYPAKKILRDIVTGGEFPYWNPLLSAGQPLAASPPQEVFYPLTWLILLPDFIYGFQWLVLVHVYIAIFGMYALLRSLGASRTAGCAGALSFGIGGLIVSNLNLFPLLFSAAWMPPIAMYTRAYLRKRMPRDLVFACAAMAMQLLVGEPMTVLQTGFILGVYALLRRREHDRWRGIARDLGIVAAISVLALLLSAMQTVPSIDFLRDSVRARGFDYSLVRDWSTPPARLAEAIYPRIFGNPRQDTDAPFWGTELYRLRSSGLFLSIYSGLLITVAALAGLVTRRRGALIYAVLAGTSILLALGDHTPLLERIYRAGFARSLRYPEKFLTMGIFATVVFGTIAFDALLEGDRRLRRIATIVAASTAAIALVFACMTFAPNAAATFARMWKLDAVEPGMLAASRSGWFIAALRGALLASLFAFALRMRRNAVTVIAIAFVCIDLGSQVWDLAPRAPRAFYTDPPPVLRELTGDRASYRVFLLGEWTQKARNRRGYLVRRPHAFIISRNALGSRTAHVYGVRTALDIDFDLTQLQVTDDFTSAAWELKDKTKDWLNYAAAMSNIRYVGMFRPIAKEAAAAGNDVRALRPIRFIGGREYPRYYFATQLVTARNRAEFVSKVASGRYDRTAAFVPSDEFLGVPRVPRSSSAN
ncbi:MAG: hypothetical protein M3Q69_17365, partial [Acidobacteriota bacterium]|nr:hypothetical protein [Acidobacteriota bacterium]